MTHLVTLLRCLVTIHIFCGFSSIQVSACDSGWFGSDCQYKCRCTGDNCGQTGECLGSSRCLTGWFGPACQYQNLAIVENVEPIPNDKFNFLLDENEDTCVSSVNEVLLDWRSSFVYPVTWLRLSFKGQDSSDFRLSFDVHQKRTVDQINSRTFTACSGETRFNVNNKTVDIFCRPSLIVYAVKLVGPAIKSLCSVYISGGRNVALRQPTSMTSASASFSRESSRIVDGVRHGTSTGVCIRTSPDDHVPQWTVNFTQAIYIDRYIIVNTALQKYRSTKVLVEGFTSSNTKVESHTEDKQNMPSKFTVITPQAREMVSRFVVSSKRGPLSLCEVEVYGDSLCSPGKYGMNCDKTCHCAEISEGCVVSTGRCPSGCAAGFTGDTCTRECNKGWYGRNCYSNCPLNCQDSECDAKSGQCLACVPGYKGIKCQEVCSVGWYGTQCTQQCPRNCLNNTCHAQTGRCLGCVSGYLGDRCEQECNKGLYGPNCIFKCPLNCQDSQCDAKSGQCLACVAGYKGKTCQEVCDGGRHGIQCTQQCPRNCLDNTCDAQTGHCLGCVSGYHGDRCEQACDQGYYGLNCTLTCPENCNNTQCESTTGRCFACLDGYQGELCDRECNKGLFGPGCSSKCPQNCQDSQCDAKSGQCLSCVTGYMGNTCEEVCAAGLYGTQCIQQCPGNCLNSTCDSITGHCLGCVSGYLGDRCEQACAMGFYGINCTLTCPENCNNSQCEVTSGQCFACLDGFQGDMCDQVCDSHSFGPNCSMKCSDSCENQDLEEPTCHHITGQCPVGCIGGHDGLSCEYVMEPNTNSINWTLVIILLVVTVSLVFVTAVIVCRFRNRCAQQLETVSMSTDSPATQNTYCRVIYTAGRRGAPESFSGVGFDNVNYCGNIDQSLLSSSSSEEINELARDESFLKQPSTSCFQSKMTSSRSYEEECGSHQKGAALEFGKHFENGDKLCVDMTTEKSEENFYEKIDDGFYDKVNKQYTDENYVYEN